MKIAGVVAEYNPFHNGHKFQIDFLKKNGFDAVVVAMSGNFVQRGESAIINKWDRAKMALENGVDLVVEIPTCYCLAPAQKFGFGAISVLNNLGVVNSLAFGSECGSLDELEKLNNALESAEVDDEIKLALENGVSFPSARQKAVSKHFGEKIGNMLLNPNDILALEYLSALKSLKSEIKPYPILRKGVKHDDNTTNDSFASASKIREMLLKNENFSDFVPKNVYDIIVSAVENGVAPCLLENAEKAVLWQLRQMSADDFNNLIDTSEGLHNRLVKSVNNATSFEKLLENAKTKRYTLAKVKRILLNASLSIYEYEMPPYIRVLGFSDKGASILKMANKKSSFPFVSSLADAKKVGEKAVNYFIKEAKYTDFYTLLCKNPQKKGAEFTQAIVKI